jgi:hypothetical protein
MVKLNLTATEIKDAQSGYQALPAGIYSATVYDAKFGDSKAGNPMYTLDFLITDGPEVRKNFKMKGWFVLKANALFSLIALNKSVGFPYPKKDTPAGEFEFPEAEEYLGKEVNLKIVREPYPSEDDEGNEIVAYRNNIKTVLPFDPDKVDGPADEDEDVVVAGSNLFL